MFVTVIILDRAIQEPYYDKIACSNIIASTSIFNTTRSACKSIVRMHACKWHLRSSIGFKQEHYSKILAFCFSSSVSSSWIRVLVNRWDYEKQSHHHGQTTMKIFVILTILFFAQSYVKVAIEILCVITGHVIAIHAITIRTQMDGSPPLRKSNYDLKANQRNLRYCILGAESMQKGTHRPILPFATCHPHYISISFKSLLSNIAPKVCCRLKKIVAAKG